MISHRCSSPWHLDQGCDPVDKRILTRISSDSNGYTNGGGYGGGGGGYGGGGYGGGGGDRMSNLGAGLQKQNWGKTMNAVVSRNGKC